MQTKIIFLLASISMFFIVVLASESDNGLYKTIPIHTPNEDSVAFAVKIRELSYPIYPDPNGLDYKTILSKNIENGNKGASNAKIMVAEFIDGIINQDSDKIKNFYYNKTPELSKEKMAKMSESWKRFNEIRITREWSFGDYKSIFLERIRQNGESDAWSFEVVVIDDRYYMAEDFGEKFNEVLMLFWYMGGEIKNGINKSNDVSNLKTTLEFIQPDSSVKGKDNKLKVLLDMKFNKFVEKWSEKQGNTENEASDFFCKARRITLDGSDEEFLSLWSGDEYLKVWTAGIERPKIDRKLLEENYNDFERLRETYKKARFDEQPFKQVCTVDLGKYLVHYFLSEKEPHQLKSIIFMKDGDNYYLTETLATNIQEFLTKGMLPKRIMKIYMENKH